MNCPAGQKPRVGYVIKTGPRAGKHVRGTFVHKRGEGLRHKSAHAYQHAHWVKYKNRKGTEVRVCRKGARFAKKELCREHRRREGRILVVKYPQVGRNVKTSWHRHGKRRT